MKTYSNSFFIGSTNPIRSLSSVGTLNGAFNNILQGVQNQKTSQAFKDIAVDFMNDSKAITSELLSPNRLAIAQAHSTDYTLNVDRAHNNKGVQLNRTLGIPVDMQYENPNKLSEEVLHAMNTYRWVYNNAVFSQNGEYTWIDEKGEHKITTMASSGVVPSLFNHRSSISIIRPNEIETPILESEDIHTANVQGIWNSNIDQLINAGKREDNAEQEIRNLEKSIKNTTVEKNIVFAKAQDVNDCRISTLVKLSSAGLLGQGGFTFADFMYCRDLGKIANNHLIVLRKFSNPVGDSIGKETLYNTNQDSNTPHRTGQLITWFDNGDNNLQDILKYDFGVEWRELNAEYQDVNSQEDQEKPLASMINLMSGNYRSLLSSGYASAGSNNYFLKRLVGNTFLGTFMDNNGQHSNETLGRYDKNKIYEPMDTIRSTYQYTGKLVFTHEFSLVFSYKLRAYDNINPKTATLDLIGNILDVTYRRGTFWKGDRWWIGPKQNTQGWKTANLFIDGALNKVGGVIDGLLNGDSSMFADMLGSIGNMLGNAISSLGNALSNVLNDPEGALKNVGQMVSSTAKKYGVGKMIAGMVKNKLGRPQLYALNSLLSEDNVGFWHVTIGNPRNPIMVMGNLILTNASIQHLGPLGVDDFPTELKVTVSLKHGRPRDAGDIGRMYMQGLGGIYQPLTAGQLQKFHKMGSPSVFMPSNDVELQEASLVDR